jgi:microcompartment protein CcmL/EutN
MGLGGKAFCVCTGEVSQVESAVAQGSLLARERGYHLRSVVIPQPDLRMVPFFLEPTQPFSDLEI